MGWLDLEDREPSLGGDSPRKAGRNHEDADGAARDFTGRASNGDAESEVNELPSVKPPSLPVDAIRNVQVSVSDGGREVETFLDCPPCPFRRTAFGSTNCAISTDPYVNEVDPLTCFNCEVPTIIAIPRCRFLSLGTAIKSYRGEGKLVVQMACKELNIRLYNFETCKKCPLYSEVPSVASEMVAERTRADVSVPVSRDMVERIAQDIKLDFQRREARTMDDFSPSQFVRCWRFEDGYCRKFPEYTRGKVTCVLPKSDRNDAIYKEAVQPALRELNLTAYRFEHSLEEVDSMCQICENQQESDFVLYNLEEWSSSAIMLIGMAHGLGKQPVLLLRQGFPKPPLLETLEHCVIEYESFDHLKFKLMAFLAPLGHEHPPDGERGYNGGGQ